MKKSAIFLILIFFFVGTAWAVPITVGYTGEIYYVDNALGNRIKIGDSVTGQFSYDTNATILLDNSTDGTGTRFCQGQSFSAEIDSNFTVNSSSVSVDIGNNLVSSSVPIRDQMLVAAWASSSDTLNGHSPVYLQLGFYGSSLWNDVSLLDTADWTALPWSDIDVSEGIMKFDSRDQPAGLRWYLTSLRVLPPSGNNPVPEPTTFILLGSGLAGLAFYRRKRK